MVKKGKKRVCIQVSEKMHRWLKESSEELGVSISNFCKKLIKQNVKMISQWTTQEELDMLIKIARTPWIKEPEDDEAE